MSVRIVNRMVVAVGISAVALLGLSVPSNAQPQPQQDQKGQADQKEKKQPGAKKRAQQAAGEAVYDDGTEWPMLDRCGRG